jgi:replicative DNA helicase
MAEQNPSKKSGKQFKTGNLKKRGEDLSDFVFGKVPPQAVPLEEAVLGAIMLEKDALTVVLDILRPSSFYTDAHQLIFKAMMRLFEKSHPIDMLTVTEELKKSGELDAAGGAYYLVELTNKVASAANIEYHARIIAQKFIQRELIQVSSKIIKSSFEDTTDVFQLLDDAEQGLFAIAQQNMSRTIDSMSSLASKIIKQLEELKDREDGLTGVPTGFTDLDRLTSGWQPSDLVIIAARPGMGKTSFVLSLAKNAALDFKKPVAIFSLEMSSIQLAQRIVSMDAEISGHKMRNGQLEDYEWQQLHSSIEKISEAPIFIDDTPGINIFELRAKCRRLKMQHDISLVIIDYLQLMSGGSDNQRGNREQEVSAISRALKGLAKELNVPVLALSQLSRAVEIRGGSKRPQLSDLRESGCLTGDTLIQDAKSGKRYTIKELAERSERTPIHVLGVDDEYKIKPRKMVKAFYSGEKQVFELITKSGRRIKASANHPFLKLKGWTALEDLCIGDKIATPREIKISEPENLLSEDELILLAHLIGDGCILPKQPYHYTSADENNIEVVSNAARSLFDLKTKVVPQKNWYHLYLKTPYHLTKGRKHPISNWYEQLGIERVRSYAKAIPNGVFQCSNEKIALFLRHLWATDGNLSWKKIKGRKPAGAIYYGTSSEKLAGQVQHLLLRLGILSKVVEIKQGKYRPMFQVHIFGARNQQSFIHQVGCFGKRGHISSDLMMALGEIQENLNIDVWPKETWNDIIEPARKAKNISWREFYEKLGLSYSGSIKKNGISVGRLKRLNQVLQSNEIQNCIESDIFWDEITEIIPLGIEPVYDATVEEVHNFVANDIIVHNSIEQDADQVAFIYRPEYYDILEDEEGLSLKGVGEIIMAKNRHGKLDTIRMKFTAEFARFSDLEDRAFDDLPDDTFTNTTITMPSKINEDEDIPF